MNQQKQKRQRTLDNFRAYTGALEKLATLRTDRANVAGEIGELERRMADVETAKAANESDAERVLRGEKIAAREPVEALAAECREKKRMLVVLDIAIEKQAGIVDAEKLVAQQAIMTDYRPDVALAIDNALEAAAMFGKAAQGFNESVKCVGLAMDSKWGETILVNAGIFFEFVNEWVSRLVKESWLGQEYLDTGAEDVRVKAVTSIGSDPMLPLDSPARLNVSPGQVRRLPRKMAEAFLGSGAMEVIPEDRPHRWMKQKMKASAVTSAS